MNIIHRWRLLPNSVRSSPAAKSRVQVWNALCDRRDIREIELVLNRIYNIAVEEIRQLTQGR